MRQRIIIDILLFTAIFTVPHWLILLVTGFCLFYFENFYEIVFIGLLLDVLYGLPLKFIPIPALYVISSAGLLLLSIFLKKYLKFYRNF